MDYKTKRRVVIAIIIIALAVIFLPIPFGKHRKPVDASFNAIPNPPTVEKPAQAQGVTPETIVQNFHAEGSIVPESPLNTESAPVASTVSAAASPTVSAPASPTVSAPGSPTPTVPDAPKTAPAPDQTVAPPAAASTTAKKPAAPPKLPPVKHYDPKTMMVETDTGLPNDPDLNTPLPANDNSLPPPPFEQSKTAAPKQSKTSAGGPLVKAKKTNAHVIQASDQEVSTLLPYTLKGEKPLLIRQSAFAPLSAIDVRREDASSANVVDDQKNIQLAAKQNHAYVLQLASFDDVAPARAVVSKLRAEGYAAFMQQATVHGRRMHRVYVGPFTHAQQAEALEHLIAHKLRMKGYVHTFNPTTMMP